MKAVCRLWLPGIARLLFLVSVRLAGSDGKCGLCRRLLLVSSAFNIADDGLTAGLNVDLADSNALPISTTMLVKSFDEFCNSQRSFHPLS